MVRVVAVIALIWSGGCAMSDPALSPLEARQSPESSATAIATSEAEFPDDSEDAEEEEGPEEEPDEELPNWFWDRLLRYYRPDPYLLDHISRAAERQRGELQCPDLTIERYRGETIRYYRTVWVHPEFRKRLQRFEKIAARVGEEVYGRAPDRFYQRGTFVCKVIRHRRYRLSEHALGNAIDIIGFGFPPLPRQQRHEAGKLGRRFKITVEDNWDGEEHREHALFWRRLTEELVAEFVFRGIITPPARGHHDHLHVDMGKWRYFRGDLSMPPVVEE